MSAPAPATESASLRQWMLQSRARLVVANIGWHVITKGVTALLALAAAGFVGRALGPEGLGLYRNVQAIAGLLAALGVIVSNQVLIHSLLTVPGRDGRQLGSAMWLAGAGGMVMLIVAILVPWQIEGQSARMAVVAACAYFPILFMVPVAAWFESRMAGRVLAQCNVAGMLLTRSWEVVCSIAGVGVAFFALSGPAGLCLMSALIAWNYRRRSGPWESLAWDKAAARELVAASLPWLVLGFTMQAQARCELFVLTALSGKVAAGSYSAAVEMLAPFFMIPGFMLSALFPSVVRSYASDHGLGQARMVQYLRLSAGLGLASALLMCLVAPWLIQVVYGGRFEQSAPALRVLSWTLVPMFMAAPWQAWLVKEKLGWLSVLFAVIALGATVVLDFCIIPTFGIVGAAAAALLAAGFLTFLLPLVFPRTREFGLMQIRGLIRPVPDLRAIMPRTNP